jgi:phosphinothricin acetyltransferase
MLTTSSLPHVRDATIDDLAAIRRIQNEGIDDRNATLDTTPKSADDSIAWWSDHGDRYAVLVAENDARDIVGWTSLNAYSHRCAYDAVADLSIYVARSARGTGVGSTLLATLERRAKQHGFHKIVLFALVGNAAGGRLYRKFDYREVGVFIEQGKLDGRFVDVLAMEKILKPVVLFVCRHSTGRSQMAEAFLRHFAGDVVDVFSAGTIPADRPNPGVVAAMADSGIDISCAEPKLIDPMIALRADRIITMGCDVDGVPRIDEDWGLPDPKDQPAERVIEIRDRVCQKAKALARELRPAVES